MLLLGGLTTPAIAGRLCVSPSTARTHCRAVLRKLAAGDRRALGARLLAGSSGAALCPSAPQPRARPDAPPWAHAGAAPEVCAGRRANFAEE